MRAILRPPLLPHRQAPLIGVGDLLRYNANAPRPFPTIGRGICRLVDLTGDGKRDFVGCGGYAYAPGWPFGGIFCFPRVGETNRFQFGDMVQIDPQTVGVIVQIQKENFQVIPCEQEFAS